ncbi:SDR family oxidoreductase [Undibacterium sp. Ji67W]|uniref:SDR family oxidoreductase n=1 Tax=Undibacterium sp. Ji67W TaxID=3413042 RepID=UPI003BF16F7A
MVTFDRSKPILVFLSNGVQGSAVVRAAHSQGLKVRALVRDPAPFSMLNSTAIEWRQANLDQSDSLVKVCAGIDHAVLQVPIGSASTMLAQAKNAFSAFKSAGVRSFVLKLASASRHLPCEEPSFVANQMIEDAARDSGLDFAVVRPTMYLENLLKPSALEDIMKRRIFAPPISAMQHIAWTSADDCAKAALILLERGAMGGDHRIAGPESITGAELVARISTGLGRHISYKAQSLDEFEREVDVAMGAGVGQRVASKFRYFAAHPDEADVILAQCFSPQAGLVDFQPSKVETWVRLNRDKFFAEK